MLWANNSRGEYTYQSIGSASFAFIRDIGNVREDDWERDSEYPADGNHGEVPPCVNVDQRYRGASKKYCHQQEEFPAPYVGQSPD